MSNIKKYGICLLKTFTQIILLLLLVTFLYYKNTISRTTYQFLKLLILLGSIFISSFILGKTSSKKGYMEGTINGTLIILFFLGVNLIFSKFQIKNILYYFIIFSTSILGSMIGKEKKKNHE